MAEVSLKCALGVFALFWPLAGCAPLKEHDMSHAPVDPIWQILPESLRYVIPMADWVTLETDYNEWCVDMEISEEKLRELEIVAARLRSDQDAKAVARFLDGDDGTGGHFTTEAGMRLYALCEFMDMLVPDPTPEWEGISPEMMGAIAGRLAQVRWRWTVLGYGETLKSVGLKPAAKGVYIGDDNRGFTLEHADGSPRMLYLYLYGCDISKEGVTASTSTRVAERYIRGIPADVLRIDPPPRHPDLREDEMVEAAWSLNGGTLFLVRNAPLNHTVHTLSMRVLPRD